jgi:TRAP-type C4-dicarboxylate transport system substrate-binding protein
VDSDLVTGRQTVATSAHAARVVTACAVAALLLLGCQASGAVDKAGGNVIVLRLASIDSQSSNGQAPAPAAFVSSLRRLSGGQIKAVVTTYYERGAVTAETDVIKSIASGRLDGGWPATRAFSRAGIRGLEPIEAPFTLTSYAAQKDLATGDGGRALLRTLRGTGVVGLGLLEGPLRRPWARSIALLDVPDWHGTTFRTYNSPVQEATVRSLGGIPVPASFNFPVLVREGKLSAAETDVAQYAHNGYGTLLPHAVANEVLWPRMLVLAINKRRMDSFSAKQRGWVQQAARAAVRVSVEQHYDEATTAGHLCALGVHFVEANPTQLAHVRHAVQPVLDALAGDPATGPSYALVREVAAEHPGADAVPVPANCARP